MQVLSLAVWRVARASLPCRLVNVVVVVAARLVSRGAHIDHLVVDEEEKGPLTKVK